MFGCLKSLVLLATPLFPWLVMSLALAGLAVMTTLFMRQRYFQKQFKKGNHPSNLEKLDHLYALIDSMPDWIYIKDRESRFILANKHVARSHGIEDPDEMTGHTDFDYYPQELARAFHDDEQRIMKSGESIVNQEEKIHDPGGNEVILSTTKIPVTAKTGEVVGIVGIGRDITKQKRDQQRLRELSMVASGTENVVVLMDAGGNFKWVNRGFEKRYKSTMEVFIEKKGANLKQNSSNEQIEEILKEVQKTREPYTYYTRTQDSDSNDAWYQTSITPILNNEGEITSLFLIDVDITTIKKADLQIKQQKYELESQRDQLRKLNASKDRLFSIIAHDLKNPFQSIIGFSELLKDGFRTMDLKKSEEYLECIHSSSTSAYDLLYNLLEWARAQTKTIKIVPVQIGIREVVGEILDLLCVEARDKNIELRNSVDQQLKVVTDLNMLNTILRNLVANAIEYTREGGNVTIRGERIDSRVDISVTDTGVGMPEEKIKNLFSLEKGKSTPGTAGETGTGLGLLVCYEFLELNKGYFRIKSEPDKGSTFTISLPVKE